MAFSDIISRVEFDCNPELKRQYASYGDYLSAAVKELSTTSLYDYAKKHPEIREYVSLPDNIMAAIDKRFAQRKEAFEIVWTEYQQSKKETSTLKYELSKAEKKYGNSPSDEAEITKALAAYQESEGTTSLLLSKAFDMTHGVA